MAIQWYPGHMTSALRVLAESIPKHDVVIEVLDARVARASANPVLGELLKEKPCLEVLAKSDLADPTVTNAWLRYFESHSRGARVAAIATTMQPATRGRVLEACRRLVGRPSTSKKNVRAIIVGIPNAGKSTLINTLMGRKVAKVGDEPAVTKSVQKVVLDGGVILTDNPGVLWPKMEDEAMSLRLALTGAVPDTVIDYEAVGLFAARFFLQRYPSMVQARYQLDPMPLEAHDLLVEIGRRRGSVRKGGVIDLHKAADALVHDFRAGALGRISLDEPA